MRRSRAEQTPRPTVRSAFLDPRRARSNDYRALGSHYGLTRDRESPDSTDGFETRARGRLTMPIPSWAATMLRIRINWDTSVSSIREGPAHEICVVLPE